MDLTLAKKLYTSEDEDFKELALKFYPELKKNKYPDSWEDLREIKGYIVNEDSQVQDTEWWKTIVDTKNIFSTEELAEASIALAQLSQLRDVYRDGWKPDWKNVNIDKYTITLFKNDWCTSDQWFSEVKFFSFQNEETRDIFFSKPKIKKLLELVKPIFM